MREFNFLNLTEAASYARRGSNSAVLKRLEYYCHHPLLADGNVIIDTPRIDAPVERDRAFTYDKIKSPDTSAVVCVLKAVSTGEMTTEETELLELIKDHPGVRDRVFYVFNYLFSKKLGRSTLPRSEGMVGVKGIPSSGKTLPVTSFYFGILCLYIYPLAQANRRTTKEMGN